jgi:hypothetical protein
MGRMYQTGVGYPDVSKLTISTWVRITRDAANAQRQASLATRDTDAGRAGGAMLGRIPLIQFGNSIEPRTGLGIGMNITWEGYLGFAYWLSSVGVPAWPDWLISVWIGGYGTSEKGWFPFVGLNRAVSSLDIADQYFFEAGHLATGIGTMWKDVELIVGGTTSFSSCSFFYPRDEDPGQLHPIVNYNGFSSTGINGFNVTNAGEDFPQGPYEHIPAVPSTWTFDGTLRNVDNNPRASVYAGDIAQETIQVNTEILFWQFYPDPKNFTIQPVPTTGPDEFGALRVDTGGTGKYFAYGQLVALFPQRSNVTYGIPAIPSTLYFDGTSLHFFATGRWPERTTHYDGDIVPTLDFSGGQLVLDSWNHIFLSIDLDTMVIGGGQDDLTKTMVDELGFTVPAGQSVAVMQVKPKWSMIVNGGKDVAIPPDIPIDFPIDLFQIAGQSVGSNVKAKITMWPSIGGHWASTRTFKMQLNGGQVGFPIIPQEIGRYKVTGPNAEIEYSATQIWFDQAIEATEDNLKKFFRRTKAPGFNGVVPPLDKEAAQKAFGTSDIWCYRDKGEDIKFQDNQGSGGDFTVVGGSEKDFTGVEHPQPTDFKPGPGQTQQKTSTGDFFPFPI